MNENASQAFEAEKRKFTSDKYDPEQNDDERRKIRMEYRNLIQSTTAQRKDKEAIMENLNKANKLYRNVKSTNEAVLDSRFLLLSSEVSAQYASDNMAEHKFDIDEYVKKIKEFLEDDEWDKYGRLCRKYSCAAPTISFLLGPLEMEYSARKISRNVIRKDEKDLVTVTQLDISDVVTGNENETTLNIINVSKCLRSLDEEIPFWKFVINPHSFSQTVENIFYCAFLAKENKISIWEREDGEYVIEDRLENMEDKTGLISSQHLLSFDMNQWKTLINFYAIKDPMIIRK
jgi:hypothetical protein